MTTSGQPSGGPTVLRILLGRQLRQLRQQREISAKQAGYRVRLSESAISRMENGQVGFKTRDIRDLLKLYGVTDRQERDAFLRLVEQANQPGWWQRFNDVLPSWFQTFVGLQEGAAEIWEYENQVIPGLLQTEDYARAVLGVPPWRPPADEIEQKVKLRLTRHQLLHRDHPPKVWMVIDEVVLRRPVGGPAVMRAQLEHLIQLTELSNLTVQILPTRTRVPLVSPSFVLLRFAEPELPAIVYVEQLSTAQYLDKREDRERYMQALSHVAVAAEVPAATVSILREVAADAPW